MQQSATKLKSLQADFVQTKTSTLFAEPTKQNGKLYFRQFSDLCWQYLNPNKLSVIMHNDEIIVKTAKGGKINPPKGMHELLALICNAINGNFLDKKDLFDIQYYKEKNYILYLIPKQKRLKNMYQNIVIYLESQNLTADKVTLKELNGDETTIVFNNKKLNETLSDIYFSTK
ncbi:MAG: outer membrane lipoprotein carrier protein LolA [Bacteroidales bacterium]|nr:outer membrane lipoprotein carrier protein LolA [Bacteroidales bacterium]